MDGPTRREYEGGEAPELDREEVKEVEERTAPHVRVIHEAIRAEGKEELKRPVAALFWSGLAAGLSMGFSLVAEGLLRDALPAADWRPLITKLGYSVGFLIVILGRQQLFTENTLTPILPLLHERTGAMLRRVLRLWGVVLAANLLGTLLFALFLAGTSVFTPPVKQAFLEIGREAFSAGVGARFGGAILAGWLIALMVWLLPYADTGRVGVIVILTYLIGLGKLSHVIAGSVETLYLVISGHAGIGAYVLEFFLPTLLGNVLGGIGLVAALNHAQVVAGRGERVNG